MTFSDSMFDAYVKIYEGISNYSDYVECQRSETIKAMVSLQKIIYSFTQLDANEKLSADVIRGIQLTCESDYAKALCNMEFGDSDSCDSD